MVFSYEIKCYFHLFSPANIKENKNNFSHKLNIIAIYLVPIYNL